MGGVESFAGWSESDGMVAAIGQPASSNKVLFVYPTLTEVMFRMLLKRA